ncbi:MAG: hypothetical protein Q4A64_08350 [Porphyromonadaceae bacterium]|nr:hypothetical protein [Porphyromonadaceae bacterium]
MARRTQRELDTDIRKAMSEIVLEQGVAGITLKEVARRTHSDINVLVRRFGTDEGAITYYTKQFDYFINEALEISRPERLEPVELFTRLATQFERALHLNKEMQEIMKWQLNINSKISRESARRREQTLAPILERFVAPISDREVDPRALLAVLVAGMYYITLRHERSTFCGIEFHTKAGRALLVETMVRVASAFLKDREQEN